tara:strand:+ start:115 stop:573 length:459 start_codon:yes stop_codon:yes gene_type:complete
MKKVDTAILDDFKNILNNLSGLKVQITSIMNDIKTTERKVNKRIRVLEKNLTKTKNKGNRKPSGFAVPSKISPELCAFMGVESGTQLARTEVTKYISEYIKNNSLQLNHNKKMVKPNEKLRNLWGIENGATIDYFQIQKLMNKHFIKANSKK